MNRVRRQKFLTDLENTKNEKLMETIVTEIKNILEGIKYITQTSKQWLPIGRGSIFLQCLTPEQGWLPHLISRC